MNLRIRDNAIYWVHRGLSAIGKIQPASLEQIQKEGFKRVLVVATTAIGDAVLCTPLIRSLRQANPQAHIGFWVSAAAKSLFDPLKDLNTVIPYHGKYRRASETMELLKKEKFDLALVANANDPDIIPMIWWSGCKRIIRRPQRNTIYPFMIANPEMLSPSHTEGHAIERNLQFCDLIKITRGKVETHLDVRPEVEQKVADLLKDFSGPYWCIHPGASRSKKQWGAGNFASVGRQILEKSGGTLILTGSPDEKSMCDEIETQMKMDGRICNLGGKLSLDELAALFKKIKLLVSGDTGPYHIAMAVGTPTVTLYAPWDIGSSAKINGPYFNLDRHRIVETPNMGDPISTISVNQVFEVCCKK